MNQKIIWPVWAVTVLAVLIYLIASGPGFALFETHWIYSVIMVFGSAVAGFTPEGGGAVAFPVLNLYFDVTAAAARDFSLAIQSIGMTSAAVWILTRKNHDLAVFKYVPLYAAVNMLAFVAVSAVYASLDFRVIQMLFVSLALSFILAYKVGQGQGHRDQAHPASPLQFTVFMLASLAGGAASAVFGTGADMLIYIALTSFYGMKEKNSTDISIVLMAVVSVLGTAYRGLVLEDIQPEVYLMWLAAAPVVLFFAPIGNWLLGHVRKESMLLFVLTMNAVNFGYFISKNNDLLLYTLSITVSLFLLFVSRTTWNRRQIYQTHRSPTAADPR